MSRGDRSRQSSGRTAEQREHDRADRARRRGTDAEPDAGGPAAGDPPSVEPGGHPDPVERFPTEELEVAAPGVDSGAAAPIVGASAPPTVPGGTRRPSRGRSWGARAVALLALAAVIAAVLLVVHSLGGSSHTRTTAVPGVVRLLIPEGETRQQIARIAARKGLSGNYLAASQRAALLSPTRYGAPRQTRNLEGFLFPATYEMNVGAPVDQLVAAQLLAFRQRFGPLEIQRARALHVTAYELLTVASMVEREAKTAHDRPLVAAVIYNRLKQGVPLGIDATIYYALAEREGIAAYEHELTEAQLRIDSPYNTRTRAGLPPTPISNPGLASIEAAAHPARVPYLYYVLAADGCGEHVFSTTYAQFELDAAAYQAAVRKNGGRPLTCKAK